MKIESLSEKQQRQVRAELSATWHVGVRQAPPPEIPGYSDQPAVVRTIRRIRQSQEPLMNGLEIEFHERLKSLYPGNDFHPQAVRFKLGNGIWYKVDFSTSGKNFSQQHAWEVKGPYSFRGGFENLKVAAGLWPEVVWHLVWKQDGQWQEQIVLP